MRYVADTIDADSALDRDPNETGCPARPGVWQSILTRAGGEVAGEF
ncbi:hypothetical protein LzC2_09470 [Planctomycetes bacterium LzC2]|uniref:Uncharacterized protein n=1 Tax=Alienimonas chondri TaxID=2681879 RepID=A0ABX1VAB2_9PLAN|nr:hypothetical protein [Alienimonas chondri]